MAWRASIHGVDLTQQMLEIAASKQAHEQLHLADVASTPLPSTAYDLCMLVLADEHLAELEPVYREAARLLVGRWPFCVDWLPPFLPDARYADPLSPQHRKSRGNYDPVLCFFSEHFNAANKVGLVMAEEPLGEPAASRGSHRKRLARAAIRQ